MRCPYCGADRLISITKNEGYSYKKGIVGAALLGPAGAVAGLDGKEKDIYHCPLCGEDTMVHVEIFKLQEVTSDEVINLLVHAINNIGES